MSTANERFETIGGLYYKRYHRLRPGMSEAPETGRSSSSEENRQLFDNWIAMQAFTDAIDDITELEKRVQFLEDAL